MARECMQKIQAEYAELAEKAIKALVNSHSEIPEAYKNTQLLSVILNQMNMDKSCIELVKQMYDNNLTSVFEDAIFTGESTKANLTFVNNPQGNGNYKPSLVKTTDYTNYKYNNKQIFQSKKKMISKTIVNCTGFLPQSEDVFPVMHLTEGDRLTDDFICPSFDGAELLVIGLRPRRMNVAINNDIYEDIGVPPMLFLLRVERVAVADEMGDACEKFRVSTAYTTCVKSTTIRFGPKTKICYNPYSNVASSAHGHICLGGMRNTFLVTFDSLAAIDGFPSNFIEGGASTHDHGTKFKTIKSMTEYVEKYKGKDFDSNAELIEYTELQDWIESCINHMSGK